MQIRRQLMFARHAVQPHLVSVNGDILNFTTEIVSPLELLTVNILPKQEGSGDPSPDNIRPISGWDGISIYTLNSENLIPLGAPDDVFSGQVESNGTISGSSTYDTFCIHVGKNTTIQYQRLETGTTTLVAFADEYLTSRTGAVTYGYLNMRNRAIRTTNSGEHPYLVICLSKNNYYTTPTTIETREVMLSIDAGVKEFAERKPIVKNHIAFGEAGTVYGGTLDVLNGVLRAYPYYASYNGETLTGEWISDRDVYTAGSTPTIGAQVVDMSGIGTDYQLTPKQITALDGVNNIWSDANGEMSAQYWKY